MVLRRIGILTGLLTLILPPAILPPAILPAAALAQEASAYAVVTHYPAPGGMEPAPTDAVAVAYGVYNNRENDYRAVTQARVDEVAALIEAETGFRPLIHNAWEDAVEGAATLQIVNNVAVEGALYTLFLPPGWTRAARLPVLLSGNGAGTSNNERLYADREIIPARVAAVGASAEGGGLIVAISNCGGTESQGVDEPTYRSVGAFLSWIDDNGGDKRNVITAGGSRGGGSALMWAINPLGLDYDVRTVFAVVPPTHYGSLSRASVLTYPSMANIGALLSHAADAWRYDNPDAPVNAQPSPFLEAILGTGDPDEADARSPIGLAERLVGKQVLIAAGAHDAFFPLSHFLEFDRRLGELDIPHTMILTLASGHESSRFFERLLFIYLLSLSHGVQTTLPDGRFYFIDADPEQGRQISLREFFAERGIEADPGDLPVIAQFPYRAGVGNPVDVVVCGRPGDAIALTLSGADGAAVYALRATLDATECAAERTAFTFAPGTYTWALTVNGQAVNPLYTPTRTADGCALRAVTYLEAEQPVPADTYAYRRTMSFGLDQYSGISDDCTVE